MPGLKFDPAKLEKLADPARLETMPPDLMWQAIDLPEARALVEIGAGTGLFAVEFARRMPGGTVWACDVADEALAWLGTHLPDDVFGDTVSAGRVVPLASTETSVPLPDASADVVAMINVHHELDDRAAMLRESARLLRPGGRLLIVDWKDEATPKGPPLAARIPARTIVREIEEAGLVDVRRHEVLPHHTMVTATRA